VTEERSDVGLDDQLPDVGGRRLDVRLAVLLEIV